MKNTVIKISKSTTPVQMGKSLLDKFNSYAGTNLTVSDVKAIYLSVLNFINSVREQKRSQDQFLIQQHVTLFNTYNNLVNTRKDFSVDDIKFFTNKAEECTKKIYKIIKNEK